MSKTNKNIYVDNDGNFGAKELFPDKEGSLKYIGKLKKLLSTKNPSQFPQLRRVKQSNLK